MKPIGQQTPRTYDKLQSYTSPIGLLKNFTTTTNPTIYQQQFFRIKAQRLQSQLQQLKQQNIILKHKLCEITATAQALKDKIYMMERTFEITDRPSYHKTGPTLVAESSFSCQYSSGPGDSKYFGVPAPNDRSQRLAFNTEVEKLLKDNRVLKNQHEIQMNKLKDENKKLTRKILQLESNKNNISEIQYERNRTKLEEKIQKLQKIINDLKKQNQQRQKQNKKLQDKLKVIQENNKALRRQSQQLKLRQHQQIKIQSIIKNHELQLQKRKKQYNNQIDKLNKQIHQLTNKSKISPITTNETTKNQNPALTSQIQLLKRKLSLHEQTLSDKDQQIKNILIKLKPLLTTQKQKQNKNDKEFINTDQKKGSISILEMFFKKYKINLF